MSARAEVHFQGKVAQKAIIERAGLVLLVQDPRSGAVFELPGGRMNLNEEPRSALIRELTEELGIECRAEEVVHLEQFDHGPEGKALLIVYRATEIDPTKSFTVDPTEVSEVGWFSSQDLATIEIYPEHRRALEVYFMSHTNKPV